MEVYVLFYRDGANKEAKIIGIFALKELAQDRVKISIHQKGASIVEESATKYNKRVFYQNGDMWISNCNSQCYWIESRNIEDH